MPPRGSSDNAFELRLAPTTVLSVCSNGALPVTSTVWPTSPTDNVIAMPVRSPAVKRMSLCSAFLKPGALTVTVYVDGLRAGRTNSPALLVIVSYTKPVACSTILTDALTTTPPEVSVTVPARVERSRCAKTAFENSTESSERRTTWFIVPPVRVAKLTQFPRIAMRRDTAKTMNVKSISPLHSRVKRFFRPLRRRPRWHGTVVFRRHACSALSAYRRFACRRRDSRRNGGVYQAGRYCRAIRTHFTEHLWRHGQEDLHPGVHRQRSSDLRLRWRRRQRYPDRQRHYARKSSRAIPHCPALSQRSPRQVHRCFRASRLHRRRLGSRRVRRRL